MHSLRRLIGSRNLALMLVFAAAIAGWVSSPAGFMPIAQGTTLVLAVCNPVGAEQVTITIPGAPRPASDMAEQKSCPFAGGSGPATSAAPPMLLAAAIAFILERGYLAAPAPRLATVVRLRPPLRGPPTA